MVAAVAQTTRTQYHDLHDPADAALKLAIRNAARNGRRICRVCAEEKPLEEFPKAGRGRSYRCRSCAMRAVKKIGEQPAPTGDRHAPPANALDAREVAEEAAESAKRVADIAEGVSALRDAIRDASGPAEGGTDPDVAHAELLDPAVTESIKRFVRGTVKETAALMVRDMVRGAVGDAVGDAVGPAVREAAAAAVPQMATETLADERRKHPVPALAEAAPQEGRERLPALVTALLERLPLQQRGWGCATERARWLAAFTAVLDVVFPIADGSNCSEEEVAHVRA